MPSTPGVVNFPTSLDDAASLLEVADLLSTTLAGSIGTSDNITLSLASATGWPLTGVFQLVDSLTAPTKREILRYTAKSGNDLTIPTGGRGLYGTTAQSWSGTVYAVMRYQAIHHSAPRDAIIAVETKLGIGAGAPVSGQFLKGGSGGASAWAALAIADVANLQTTLDGKQAAFANQNANLVYAGPSSGGAAAPSFRALVAGDIPDLSATYAAVGHNHDATYQPLDPDLTAIAALSANGLLRKTAGVWGMDSASYLTGNQTITLSGDLSGSGATSISATIANGAVSLAKMANLAANSIIGNNTGSAATPLALTAAQVTAMLNAFVGDSGSGGTKGLVPAPASGDATKYLKGDGTWASVSVGAAGSDTQLQRNASGALGAITGATSDGTNVTFGSGNLRATSPRITTALSDANGNAVFNLTATTSAIFGLDVVNAASGGTVSMRATPPTQAASGIVGTPLTIGASNAIAGNTNAGAVAGGALTLAAGDAARLTSGNGDGGNVNLNPGNRVGSGTLGAVVIQDNGGSSLANARLRFASQSANNGWDYYFGWVYLSNSGSPVFGLVNGDIRIASSSFGLTSSVGAGNDIIFERLAAGNLRFRGTSSTTPVTIGSPALTPAQITSDQNNYAPGTALFQRWSSDASRNVTGLSAGQDGQMAFIWNSGSFDIVLAHESASSTAANRFTCSGAANITLSGGNVAFAQYDATASRWRVVKL